MIVGQMILGQMILGQMIEVPMVFRTNDCGKNDILPNKRNCSKSLK